jgi:hypothetical protein
MTAPDASGAAMSALILDFWTLPLRLQLRGMGIETMITHWPFMSPDSVWRAEYEAAGLLAINRTSGHADLFWEYLQVGANTCASAHS